MVRFAGFEKYFRVISYLVALSGLFALFVSGGVGVLVFAGFLLASMAAWLLEDTKWQLSERVAVTIVALAVVGFFLDWQFHITSTWNDGIFAAAGLARLILFLSAIKLLQKKADKDWIFIYVISFFEVLLAAGLSISPLFLLSLFLYLFSATSAIIAYEIRRSSRSGATPVTGKKETGIRRNEPAGGTAQKAPGFRLPVASLILLAVITLIGLPIFFTLPRGNAAGFGNEYASRVNVTGFSDSVSLGTIGTLQKNDAIVMRVRIDQNNNDSLNRLLWRGVALDRFNNLRWSKSNPIYRRPYTKDKQNLVQFYFPPRKSRTTIQTYYLEPLNTNVLFALRRPYAVQGIGVISHDSEGALLGFRNGNERISYKVYSDTSTPEASVLRADKLSYRAEHEKYLQMPDDLDPRIRELAASYVRSSGSQNRYDIAKTIEARLQKDFGYSLEMKASGPQPVADFLFNVKTGHCEYFASAMAMMLRTQGIASRIVNGFQSGDYNETAGVYVVRQQNAHSWVEVYFPETNSWAAFDPTPPGGLPGSGRSGFFGAVSGYIEALETFWIQYVVAYDGQEQKSILRSFRDELRGYSAAGSEYLKSTQDVLAEWWEELRGDAGVVAGFRAAGIGLAVIVGIAILVVGAIRLWRVLMRLRFVRWFAGKIRGGPEKNRVEFYRQMEQILAKGGFAREKFQTPNEFAMSTGITEVESMTEKYNHVRFGGYEPDPFEIREIEQSIERIKEKVAGLSKRKQER